MTEAAKTPLVLIPGLMCDARLWEPQMPAFGRRTVVHAAITEADSISTLAVSVLANAPPRFALAGFSMGGIVAMEIVRQAPGRVERLALLSTNPKAEHPDVASARAIQIEAARNGELRGVMENDLLPRYLAPKPTNPKLLELCLDMALGLGPGVFERQARALATRADQQDTLAGYRGPALLLIGEEDRLCPPDRHDLMRRLMPHAISARVANAGHLPTLEKPAETRQAVSRWLEVVA